MSDSPVRRRHIGRAQAQRVDEAFLAAPRYAPSRVTAAAYAQLGEQSTGWYALLTSGCTRRPIRVVLTHQREPYERDVDRRHPVLDTTPGGAYDRLRAVHDIVSHGWIGHAFDADGEYSAWLTEDRMYSGLARWALATDLHGEHSVAWTTKDIADHKAVLLAPGLIRASRHPDGDGRAAATAGSEVAPCASS